MIYGIERASLLKRIFASILDVILLSILATGFAFLSAKIAKVDYHQKRVKEYYTYYETTYNVKFGLTQEDFNRMSDEERAHYEEVNKIIAQDKDFIKENSLVQKLMLLVVIIGLFLGTLIVEFVIPLFLKNGQTVGKKVFSLCLVRKDAVKVTSVQLFARSIIGKFALELMAPTYLVISIIYGFNGLVGLILVGVITIIQIVLLIATKNKTLIHDLIALTVVVDKQTQMIFESEQDLIKYKEKVHLESVKNSKTI